MSEWVKGLDADRKMEFSHTRGQQISHITKDTLELSENKDLVTITDKSSGKVMQQWENHCHPMAMESWKISRG